MNNEVIFYNVERLINYSIKKELIEEYDSTFVRNSIYNILGISGDICFEDFELTNEKLDTCTEILMTIANCAIENNIIEKNITEIDLFITKIMGVVTPKPSEVKNRFFKLYEEDKQRATNYFYKLSKDTNYIMVDRVKENVEWVANTKYGDYYITINVSKPEKTTAEIAKAKLVKSSGYPKCLLCKENVGFCGNINHPARQNLRTIPVLLNNEKWQMQYSPYVYYNEHCIVFNENHVPMKISKETFVRLLDFVEFVPHYFIGSNADLPIVGGSILSHDHFQGGSFELPMAKAKDRFIFTSEKFNDVKLSIVEWPMSVVRISSKNKFELLEVANLVLECFKSYNVEEIGLISDSNDIPHNTITPVARLNKSGEYEFDLVLRNNRTSDEYPDGIFHTHKETFHIKKENIGLIEAMGLAVLPKRLIDEFSIIKKYLKGEIKREYPRDDIHYDWVKFLISKYGTENNEIKLKEIFQSEIAKKFENCLIDSGIFKNDEIGNTEFKKFIYTLGFKQI